jgi:hypothetical protein
MEDTVNRESVERLVGPYSQYRRRSTIDAVEVKEECRVDTINGIETAYEGDYISIVPGKGIAVINGCEFDEAYIPVEEPESIDNDPTDDELEDQTKQ